MNKRTEWFEIQELYDGSSKYPMDELAYDIVLRKADKMKFFGEKLASIGFERESSYVFYKRGIFYWLLVSSDDIWLEAYAQKTTCGNDEIILGEVPVLQRCYYDNAFDLYAKKMIERGFKRIFKEFFVKNGVMYTVFRKGNIIWHEAVAQINDTVDIRDIVKKLSSLYASKTLAAPEVSKSVGPAISKPQNVKSDVRLPKSVSDAWTNERIKYQRRYYNRIGRTLNTDVLCEMEYVLFNIFGLSQDEVRQVRVNKGYLDSDLN